MQKIIVIVGPTASGKSDLAVQVAKKFNGLNRARGAVGRTSQSEVLGEVISADSRQVYKGLDIGTGKITKREMRGVRHHLLDVANPKTQFSVDKYKALADKAIQNILSRGKIPILCGGTGFYIDAVAQNILLPDVPPNRRLRKMLAKKSADSLFKMLQKLDQKRAKTIDGQNKVRLIRAIEIAKALGKVPKVKANPQYQTLYIGVKISPEILKERIVARLIKRMRAGMIEETKRLHRQGLSWKRMNELGLEYRYMALFLQNQITKSEMIEKLSNEIWHYAKRQMTWFKRNKSIIWIDPKKTRTISKLIQKF